MTAGVFASKSKIEKQAEPYPAAVAGRGVAAYVATLRVIADRYAKGATIPELLAQEYDVGVGTIWRALLLPDLSENAENRCSVATPVGFFRYLPNLGSQCQISTVVVV